MKTSTMFRKFAVIAVSLSVSGIVHAQQPAPPKAVDPATMINVKKFVGMGRVSMIKTPAYSTTAPRSVTIPQEWAQVSVEYETAPEWIDEIAFSYHVLSRRMENGRELFSLYKKVVKYADVEKGRNHISTVFIRPNAIKRYGDIVAIAVEISIDGKPAAVKSEIGMKMPADWWKNAAVVESKAVTVRDGYLLDRSQTPFAFVNVDDYEVIK